MSTVESDLTAVLGAIDARSDILPWAVSPYYQREMGGGLLRRFLSFARLCSPEELAPIKLRSQAIENGSRTGPAASRRTINIDPGYLESGKVVLASTKNASHRIYLARGIYGEATLLYQNGAFHGCPYTYPDYLWPETLAFFDSMRRVYLEQLRRVT
jgi:hypothetical protein